MLTHNGVNLMFNATAGKGYIDDFCEIDAMRPLLRYERMFFNMLDAYRPAKSHWTLKAPLYASCFPNFFQEYPDARVVLTHRNPLVTLSFNFSSYGILEHRLLIRMVLLISIDSVTSKRYLWKIF